MTGAAGNHSDCRLTGEVLQHGGQVHGRAGADTGSILALLQVPALVVKEQ